MVRAAPARSRLVRAAARIPVDLLVFVAAMIPSPGELFNDWWGNSRYEASGYDDVFYHDVPRQRTSTSRLG